MLTIKLVVIGASGVGKTSLRNQYISGRYSTGYRATIGADFIAKVLPHPTKPNETVTLQIWDTAGQERFSSLSSALFRGADAALLMFDVNDQNTLQALEKWWDEFRDKAPLPDEVIEEFCAVVVGNKMDMVTGTSGNSVSRYEVENFVRQLIPTSELSPRHDDIDEDPDADADDEDSDSGNEAVHAPVSSSISPSSSPLNIRSSSIAISHPLSTSTSPRGRSTNGNTPKLSPYSRSRSSSRFYSVGTATTTLSIYHTPSSSYSHFESARSSPEPPSSGSRRMTRFSNASTSSGSTVTPSLFAKRTHSHDSLGVDVDLSTAATTPESTGLADIMSARAKPAPLDRGPKVFFTSAKTGQGVRDVFEYIASRVVRKWEYDERRMGIEEASSAFNLGLGDDVPVRLTKMRTGTTGGGCCGS